MLKVFVKIPMIIVEYICLKNCITYANIRLLKEFRTFLRLELINIRKVTSLYVSRSRRCLISVYLNIISVHKSN